MIRLLILIAIVGVLHTESSAQRVLYNSQQLNQPNTKRSIRTIRPNWALSPTITVVYADGHKEKVDRETIWGYEDRKKRVYRYHKNGFYRLMDTGDVIHYRQSRTTGRGMASVNYFSSSLDSPVCWTKRKARKDTADVR